MNTLRGRQLGTWGRINQLSPYKYLFQDKKTPEGISFNI